MAYTHMDVAPVRNFSEQKQEGYEYEETLSSGTNGTSVIIPSGSRSVQVTVTPQPVGEGKVQATTSRVGSIQNDTAEWVDWPAGNVTAATQDVCDAPSAIRLVRSSGTVKIEMRAN